MNFVVEVDDLRISVVEDDLGEIDLYHAVLDLHDETTPALVDVHREVGPAVLAVELFAIAPHARRGK